MGSKRLTKRPVSRPQACKCEGPNGLVVHCAPSLRPAADTAAWRTVASLVEGSGSCAGWDLPTSTIVFHDMRGAGCESPGREQRQRPRCSATKTRPGLFPRPTPLPALPTEGNGTSQHGVTARNGALWRRNRPVVGNLGKVQCAHEDGAPVKRVEPSLGPSAAPSGSSRPAGAAAPGRGAVGRRTAPGSGSPLQPVQ